MVLSRPKAPRAFAVQLLLYITVAIAVACVPEDSCAAFTPSPSTYRRSCRSRISVKMSETPQEQCVTSKTTVAKTKWLELQTIDYTDPTGKARKWDAVTRTTKPAGAQADAVVVIPLLKYYDESKQNVCDTILVEQFRPPVGQKTLEFPAGLIDAGETPAQAAMRELREETGYVGEACKTLPVTSRPLCMSPGVTDESVHTVVVTVDLDNPYNQNPKPELDDGEFITLHRVSLKDGIQKVLDQEASSMPIEGLYLFSVGLELGKSLGGLS